MLALLVLAADQGVKWLLGRALRNGAASLGPLGRVQLVRSRVWLARAGVSRAVPILAIWMACATALTIVSVWMPSAAPWSALLIGGSFSHAMESVMRGFISDYICLRFWPALNLADVAITSGAIGVVVTVATHC